MKKLDHHRFLQASKNERLGSAKLILVETLQLIIKNDKLNDFTILNKVDD